MSFNPNAKKHQEEYTKSLSNRNSSEVYEIQGVECSVRPKVFPPASDTRLLAKHIKVKVGENLLELTCGSGILSIIAAKQGAKVTAIDINKDAIENAKENFSKHKVKVTTIVSDLFSNVPHQKFDYILVNGPYFEGKVTKDLEYASLDVKKFLTKLLVNLPEYLNKKGKLLITFAEFGEHAYFIDSINKYGFKYYLVDFILSSDKKRRYNLYCVQTT